MAEVPKMKSVDGCGIIEHAMLNKLETRVLKPSSFVINSFMCITVLYTIRQYFK